MRNMQFKMHTYPQKKLGLGANYDKRFYVRVLICKCIV